MFSKGLGFRGLGCGFGFFGGGLRGFLEWVQKAGMVRVPSKGAVRVPVRVPLMSHLGVLSKGSFEGSRLP